MAAMARQMPVAQHAFDIEVLDTDLTAIAAHSW
jgi:hypothetical protein